MGGEGGWGRLNMSRTLHVFHFSCISPIVTSIQNYTDIYRIYRMKIVEVSLCPRFGGWSIFIFEESLVLGSGKFLFLKKVLLVRS